MRADLLRDNFEMLVKTPEDVKALEAAILDLAVRGKLVPQDANDEPAGVLLERILVERKRSAAEGKSRLRKLAEIDEQDVPSHSPSSWAWARLGNVFELAYGKALPKRKRDSDGDVPVYGSNGIVGHHGVALVEAQCIVVGRKGSAGAVNLALQPCWVIDTAYYVVPPDGIDPRFAFYLLMSLGLEELGRGIKPGLNRNETYNIVIPVPPMAEQKRIVARIDEVMSRAHKLATELQATEAVRARMLQAVLNGD